jgi:hypothetical protein
MRLILYTQYYRARTPQRQAELDHCLRSNLQHPALDQVVVLREPDAPELPGEGCMPVQQIEEAERLTYAGWIKLLQKEPDAIGILINSDIALGKGWEQLEQVLNTPESVLALSRYNPSPDGGPPRLNKFPHWTQDTWALRSDAPITGSLLYASGFPIGYPGCDNRIAYVLWSHGLTVKNPCYALETLHHQADELRYYNKNSDRLYGGTSYVHPTLSLGETSELEHTLWTRASEGCPGVLVNQQAVERGVHQLHAIDDTLKQQFLAQQKSTGLAWSQPPLGGASSAHAETFPLAEVINTGVHLELGARQVCGLQLRLPAASEGHWRVNVQGQQRGQSDWQPVDAGPSTTLEGGGKRLFLEEALAQQPWQRLQIHLEPEAESPANTAADGLLEVLVFCAKEDPPPQHQHQPTSTPAKQALQLPTPAAASARPLQLRLQQRRLEPKAQLNLDSWNTVHRWSSRFALLARDGRIAFVDRFWPTTATFADPELDKWDSQALREGFLWGFTGPVLEWKPQQFSTEKLYLEQLNFWQYPCRTEQDAYERHLRMDAPYWDGEGVHVYVGMPWATWIDKKTFPDQLLEAYRSRLKAISELLGEPLQVHSVCQHIRWKEHPHRFEQAGINQLWIAHKEKGWDQEGRLQLHSWPLYPVNVLDPERREGLEFVPVEKKTIFASFKGAHMKHYPSEIRLHLQQLTHHVDYQIEVTDLWHFNKVVYNHQVANQEADRDAIEGEEITAYNRLLSQTLFSLCPAGAGPNTLRLWESLGIGSIPVVFSDRYDFPTIPRHNDAEANWQQAVVLIPEDEVHTTHARLAGIDTQTAALMQSLCREIHAGSLRKTCFSALTGEPADPAPPRSLRALVIGSSVSIQKAGYLPALQVLAQRSYATDLQVLNASLGGCSTQASLAYLKGELFYNTADFNADIALIEKCPNERHQRFSQLSPEQQQQHEQQVIGDTLELCAWCRQRGITPILVCSCFMPGPEASWQHAEPQGYLRRSYEAVANQAQVPLIDLHTRLGSEHELSQLLLDDVHLNETGAAAMAHVVAEALLGPQNLAASTAPAAPAHVSTELALLFRGATHTFSTRLLNTTYAEINVDPTSAITIDVEAESELTGIFYISDQESSAITITADCDESTARTLLLLDHMSFMPRVTYRQINGLTAHRHVTIRQSTRPVDTSQAIEAYHKAKTFNPEEDWARTKYLQPLLDREQGRLETCEKIIAVFGRRSQLV